MSIINLGFDLKDVQGNFDPLPRDKYIAFIANIGVVPSKAGHQMVKIEFVIAEGNYRGRKVFGNYCINHPSDTPKNIARARIKDIARAIGQFKDGTSFDKINTNDFLRKKLELMIELQKENPKYNEITNYSPLSSHGNQINFCAESQVKVKTDEKTSGSIDAIDASFDDIPF